MAKKNQYDVKPEYVVDSNTKRKLDGKGRYDLGQAHIFSRTREDAKQLYLKDNPNKKIYSVSRETTDSFKKEYGGHNWRVTGIKK